MVSRKIKTMNEDQVAETVELSSRTIKESDLESAKSDRYKVKANIIHKFYE